MGLRHVRNLILLVSVVLLSAVAVAPGAAPAAMDSAGAAVDAVRAAAGTPLDPVPHLGLSPAIDVQSVTGTTISGDIFTSSTWTRANSPYNVVGSVTVHPTATLTIEPGVEVDFDSATALEINGTLIAVGTVTQPIAFTGASNTPGFWARIGIWGTAAAPISGSILDHVVIEDAGYYVSSAGLIAMHATVTVSNSVIRNSKRDGIVGQLGGVVNLLNDTFTGNQGYAVRFNDGSVNPQLANLSASGNLTNTIGWGNGTLSGTHNWPAAGLPYTLYYNGITIAPNSTLVISPGVEIDFAQAAGIEVNGSLSAIGTVSNPITFTGTTKTPGWWSRIGVVGSAQSPSANATLDHVLVEDAGYYSSGEELYAFYAALHVSNSIIKNSRNGITIDQGASGSMIEGNLIYGNTGYGLDNLDPAHVVLAANNWWGAASGPTVDGNCNPVGTGSKVSAGVAFKPFLASPDQVPDLLAPSNAAILRITPERWFVPADSVTRAYVSISLTDGSGSPMPGRSIHLASTRGLVADGGITNFQGQTLAYVTSASAGDAEVTAFVTDLAMCEMARSPVSQITFTSAGTGVDLVPGAKAPYLNDGVEISPLPVVMGVTTTIRVHVVNPNSFAISVNGVLGFAQSGIGLAFGPLKQVAGLVVPANSQGVVETEWVPPISGHYCFRFDYTAFVPSGPIAGLSLSPNAGGWGAQNNQNVRPAPFKPPQDNHALEVARAATGRIEHGAMAVEVHENLATGPWHWILSFMFGHLLDFLFDHGETAINAIRTDPPRQDYKTLATLGTLEQFSFVLLQPGPDMPGARAQAINDLTAADLSFLADADAAQISLDRYGGASENEDISWEAQQSEAFFFFKIRTGQDMLTVANKLDALSRELHNEGFTELLILASDYQAYQQRLAMQGYSTDEVELAHSVGLTDADLARIRQETLAEDPNVMSGSLFQKLADLSSTWRDAGNVLIEPPLIGGFGVVHSSARPASVQVESNHLARIYTSEFPISIGNPLSQTVTINFSVRRVDVPLDWQVSVPPSLTLAAGGETAITVTVQSGTAVLQGTHPQMAVEGYVNGSLLGGVLLDVEVPYYTSFDGYAHVYLPSIVR